MSELTREQIDEAWPLIELAIAQAHPNITSLVPDLRGRARAIRDATLSAAAAKKEADGYVRDAEKLPADVLTMCRHRGWSLHWTHRGSYLHLESSELIEAVRGKRSDVLSEAGDVLLVLMSITEYAGVCWSDVLAQARKKCDELMERPRYPGEEFSDAAIDQAMLASAPEMGEQQQGNSASGKSGGFPCPEDTP